MSNNWLMFVLFTWLCLAVLSGVAEGAMLGTSGAASRIDLLVTLPSLTTNSVIGTVGIWDWCKNLAGFLTFDYPAMFPGWLIIFRYFLMIFGIIIVVNIIALFRGVGSSG